MNLTIKEILLKDSISNEYLNKYMILIETALLENRIKRQINDLDYIYYESHHILPKSLYIEYKNCHDNIVLLTAREHFDAHFYLTKMFNSSKLDFAYWRLCTDNRGRKITAEEYEYCKQLVAIRISQMNKGKTLTEEQKRKIIASRKGYKHSEETKSKIRMSHIGKTLSKESKQKITKSKLGKPLPKWSDERKEKLSQKYKGTGNPMYGKNVKNFMSDDKYNLMCIHISESLVGRQLSDETRQKISKKCIENHIFQNENNPKAKSIKCVEDNISFNTLKECGIYYNIPRHHMTKIAKSGYYEILDKHFILM